MPGIEVDTGNSSPREFVVINDIIYFTNWNTQDVKVFNLFNYVIEESIPVEGLPEDIIFDGILDDANIGQNSYTPICINNNINATFLNLDAGNNFENLYIRSSNTPKHGMFASLLFASKN